MIKSFGDKESEKIWRGIRSKKLPSEIQDVVRRKLRMIYSSQDLNDLRIPPANRLEKLKGGNVKLSQYPCQQPMADHLSVEERRQL